MPVYKVGDTVIHTTYGRGKVTAIDDKGTPGAPCFFYVIEAGPRTLWVPADEAGSSSLHLPTTPPEYKLLIDLLRSPAQKLPNNPYERHSQLAHRMQKASPRELCLVIRDLNYRARSRSLSGSDQGILKHAQSTLLDEWEQSLGTPRDNAMYEMGWALRDTPRSAGGSPN